MPLKGTYTYRSGENAVGGHTRFAGSLGTQVVKVFDLIAARTGLREHEAAAAGFTPLSSTATPDDHKRYYPGARPITIRVTGDAATGRLLGAQLIGQTGTDTAKRVDTYATALFHDMTVAGVGELDLSYTPPLGSPWDAVQICRPSLGTRAPTRLPAGEFATSARLLPRAVPGGVGLTLSTHSDRLLSTVAGRRRRDHR